MNYLTEYGEAEIVQQLSLATIGNVAQTEIQLPTQTQMVPTQTQMVPTQTQMVPTHAMSDDEFVRWVRFKISSRQLSESYVTKYRGVSRKCSRARGTVQDALVKIKAFEEKCPWLMEINNKQWLQQNITVMENLHKGLEDHVYARTCFEIDEWYSDALDSVKAFWSDQKELLQHITKLSTAVNYLYEEMETKKKIYTEAMNCIN